MANGDLASQLGWTTFTSTQDRKQGYDNDNYALDRAAEQAIALRDTILPAINQPMFSVKKSTNADVLLNSGTIYWASSGFWQTPILNDGFSTWSGGQLTVKKAGVYRLGAHMQVNAVRDSVAVFLVKNTTSVDFPNNQVLIKDSSAGRGVTITDLVRLSVGDRIAMMVTVSDTRATSLIEANAFDLSFSAEWVRA